MSKKYRIVFVVLALVAWFGYRYYQSHHTPATKTARQTARNPAPPAPPRMLGKLAFKPCTLAPEMGAGNVEAQCSWLEVVENPAAPQGRKLRLNIAWIPADENGSNEPDPVFMLAGGPGQSATESYPMVASAFREVNKDRSVILIDQRGTGQSNPLTCTADEADAQEPRAISDTAAMQAMLDQTKACRDRLSQQADLRFYTTTDATRDLDAVRQAIGAETINLIGISYGTRVAQQYAMHYPKHTRSIVLDSVAPNSISLGNDFARNLESSLNLQLGQCGKIPSCAKALGNPRDRLNQLLATLKTNPPLVSYRDSNTGELKQERLTTNHVAALARMYSYSPVMASVLPLLLNQASQGQYDGLMSLSKMLSDSLSEQMAAGMQFSVICTEDADGLKSDPSMANSVLGNLLIDALIAQCKIWPKGSRPVAFHQPLTTSVPALLLSGELDPVTPPAYADSVAKMLPNSRALVLRGQGHNVIGAGCMPKLFAQFIHTADAKTLNVTCLDALAYTPPFTSFNGWEP